MGRLGLVDQTVDEGLAVALGGDVVLVGQFVRIAKLLPVVDLQR